MDDAAQVTIVVESDAPGTLIERRANVVEGWETTLGIPVYTSTQEWEPVCAAPCRVAVNPHSEFRVNGRGIATSRELVLPAEDAKGEVRLDVRTRSAFWHTVGQAATIVGSVLVVVGGVSALYAPSITDTDEEKTVRRFGIGFLAGGGLMMAVGIPLWITQRSWVRGPDGSAL